MYMVKLLTEIKLKELNNFVTIFFFKSSETKSKLMSIKWRSSKLQSAKQGTSQMSTIKNIKKNQDIFCDREKVLNK